MRIAKWLGDGAMLVCVETRPLLEAIIELHQIASESSNRVAEVSIRSGITSGDVILMEGDDYIGHCVNVAARLSDLAEGGEALADPSVMAALPRWGSALEYRDISLRGVEKPIRVARIGMTNPGADSRLDPICGLTISEANAEETALDGTGSLAFFCSSSCLDTWRRRPDSSSSSTSVAPPTASSSAG